MVHTASILAFAHKVIKRIQTKLSIFFPGKKDKIKEGVRKKKKKRKFAIFAITGKTLPLSRIGRLLEKTLQLMRGKLFQMRFSKSMEVSTSYSSAITIQTGETKVYRCTSFRTQY